MANAQTARTLTFLGYDPRTDFEVEQRGAVFTLSWFSGDPEPSEATLDDALSDLVANGDGQVYSQWNAEHGGNATLTLRRQAKEALDAIDTNEALIRALALTVLDEINILRAQHSLAARTTNQLRNAIKAKLDAGDADT